jgi:hypothetical protein
MTLPINLDKHTLALISIIGSSLDVLGALYLAYDLLGGEHGPLRTLTRIVTYGALFGTGYGLSSDPSSASPAVCRTVSLSAGNIHAPPGMRRRPESGWIAL